MRTAKWYRKTFEQHGFAIVFSKLHNRIKDGYDDEMLYCLQPITITHFSNLKYNLKADAIVIDCATKFHCSHCFSKENKKKEEER